MMKLKRQCGNKDIIIVQKYHHIDCSHGRNVTRTTNKKGTFDSIDTQTKRFVLKTKREQASL
jgi:hypothetical protein